LHGNEGNEKRNEPIRPACLQANVAYCVFQGIEHKVFVEGDGSKSVQLARGHTQRLLTNKDLQNFTNVDRRFFFTPCLFYCVTTFTTLFTTVVLMTR
jgi:hypothetical protein